MTEDGGAQTVTVKAMLNGLALPAATKVTVSVGDGSDSATEGTDYGAVSDVTVTISAGQTSGTETFTITPVNDSVAEGDETVSVSGSTSGLTGGTASLTITDDETASSSVALSVSPSSVGEGAGAATVTVTASLNADARTVATKVTVSVGDGSDSATEGTDYASVNDVTVTISAGQTSGEETFTITPSDDSFAEGDETVSVSGSTSGLTVRDTELTINDDDMAGVVVDPKTLTVGEGASKTYTLKLSSQPGGNVTVSASSNAISVATVSPASVTFSTTNWNDAQTVTVSGVQDDDANNESATISHKVSGYGSVTTANDVAVSVTDDETASVLVDPKTLTVGEGASKTYTLKLSSQPGGNVTVSASSSATDVARVSPASVTFSTTNWNEAQTVTVSGVQDDDANNESATISHKVSGYGSVTTANDVAVSVTDDETAGVVVSPKTLTVGEGASKTYTLKLSSQPGGNVTVTATSGALAVATVSPGSVTFTSDNWRTAQTVTVSGIQDDDANNGSATISHTVSGYGSVNTADDVAVSVTDDETAGVVVDPKTLTVDEGSTNTYTLKLSSKPGGNVTVSASSNAIGVAKVSPASVTFSTDELAHSTDGDSEWDSRR